MLALVKRLKSVCASYFRYSVVEDQTLTLEQLKAEVFRSHWDDDTWREVLLLVIGIIGLPRSKELIEYCLTFRPQERAVVFAARCFREIDGGAQVRDLSEGLRAEMESVVSEVTRRERFENGVDIALEVWGPAERNHQFIRTATRNAVWTSGWLEAID